MSGELRSDGGEQVVHLVRYASTTLVLTEEPPPDGAG